MTRPLRIEFAGAYYHVTSRGNERRNVFRNNRDRQQFLSYLNSAHYRYKAVFHVFCLMDNHYHLLMETPKGNLSQIMHHINGAYTNYFNIRHKRRGHLFQGRYKAIIVDADSYAGELSRYIHLNPVRTGLIDAPEKYHWSSYRYYLGRNKKPEWLSTGFILRYFKGEGALPEKRYKDFVQAKMHMRYDSPIEETAAAIILGSEDFVEMIQDKYINGKNRDRELPAIGQLARSIDITEIFRNICEILHLDASLSKKITIYLCHQEYGMKLKQIGNYFNVSESAVSEASRRFNLSLKKSRELQGHIETLKKKLNLWNV